MNKQERKTFVVGLRINAKYKDAYRSMTRLEREVLREYLENFFRAKTMEKNFEICE